MAFLLHPQKETRVAAHKCSYISPLSLLIARHSDLSTLVILDSVMIRHATYRSSHSTEGLRQQGPGKAKRSAPKVMVFPVFSNLMTLYYPDEMDDHVLNVDDILHNTP